MPLDWNSYPVGAITKVKANTYVLRTKKILADLEPSSEKVFGDQRLSITGYYNLRGIIVGYELTFKGKPSILLDNFYIVLDYVEGGGNRPNHMTFPKLQAKEDSSICLVKYGKLIENRLYVFIYRRKQDG